jgi:hypothetical protein
MTNEERNIAIADMRRMKNEYMNGRKIDEVAERKCKSFEMAIKVLEQQPCDEVVSRQAALNSLIDNTHLDGYDLAEALDAIENKEKLPSVTVQRQPCEDAISREAVKKWICKTCPDDAECQRDCDVIKGIDALPPVTQKYGKWIDYRDEGFVECPYCGHATNCEDNIDELHYCFYCGAKMQESE